MQIIPAIDLKDNKCVRLTQGKDETSVVFNDDPEKQAVYFQKIGCKKIHIVDLDAAFGRPKINFDTIKKIRKAISINIQLGGGIRSKSQAEKYLDLGINNLIIGSMSISEPETVKSLSYNFQNKIYVSLDINENNVMIKGWKKKSNLKIDEVIDIYNQSKYLIALNEEMRKLKDEKLFEISKNFLIREKIKKITLNSQNKELKINDQILNSYIKSSFGGKKINNLRDYRRFVESIDLEFEYMKEKLIIDLLWNNLIFNKFSSKIKINKNDLKKEILSRENKYIVSYLLHEIVFEASTKTEINSKYEVIQNNINEVGFENTALIYSISDTSTNGGYLGWINESSLNNQVLKEIINLKIGENSSPILVPGGFLILKIEDKKTEEREIDLEKELNNLVRIKSNQQLNEYSNIYFNKIKKDVIIYD